MFKSNTLLEPLMMIAVLFLCSAFLFGLILKIKFINNALNKPLDFSKQIKGERIFGENKTWRVFPSQILGAWIGLWIIKTIIHHSGLDFPYIQSLVSHNLFSVGLILGIGTEIGELINSFIKRRLQIDPGQKGGVLQFVFDQCDVFISGSLSLSLFVEKMPWSFFVWGMIEIVLFHSILTIVVKLLKIKTK